MNNNDYYPGFVAVSVWSPKNQDERIIFSVNLFESQEMNSDYILIYNYVYSNPVTTGLLIGNATKPIMILRSILF